MGRRTPRQTPETAQLVHDREGFLGALRGRTNVPIPVGRDANSLARSRAGGAAASAVRAYQDVLTLTGVADETVELTYLPLTYSEHAYLNGVYQQEGADYDWTRESGTRTITIKAAMDARAGDVLIVEYLYYAGVPAPPVNNASAIPSGPRVWYKLDELAGTTAEDSANNYDGTYSGSYTLGQPPLSGGDGTSVLSSGGGLVTAQTFGAVILGTIGYWISTTTTTHPSWGTNPVLVSSPFKIWGSIGSSSIAFGSPGAYLAFTGVNLADGNPHHVVAVSVTGGMKLYIDGALHDEQTTPGFAFFYDSTGGWASSSYTGSLDDVIIYDRQVSAAEVEAWHAGGTS